MVSHGDCGHAQFTCFFNKGLDPSSTIKHRELGVVVQVDERLICHQSTSYLQVTMLKPKSDIPQPS
jgi:hypothetical protein